MNESRQDKSEFTIRITLKNGHSFEHKEPTKTTAEMIKFYNKILSSLARSHKGYMTFHNPLSLYDTRDISSIHFIGIEPEAANKIPIGFRPLKDGDG